MSSKKITKPNGKDLKGKKKKKKKLYNQLSALVTELPLHI